MEFNATFIVAFISFIIFIITMNMILYQPISDIVEKRQKFIDENYNEANVNNEKSKNLLKDKENKIQYIKNNAKEKLLNAQDNAKEKKNHNIHIAKQQANVDIEEKIIDFQNQSNNAREVLKNDTISLAQMICDKLIGEQAEKINS